MKIDPIKLAKNIEKAVIREEDGIFYRKYWRFRGGRWYGGIATADCVGCNLACVFCGPITFMEEKGIKGKFYDPTHVARKLKQIAYSRKYKYLRVSGGEPTIGFKHLMQVIENVSDFPGTFIVETNGILIGWNKSLAEALSDFHNIHVRVSIKGTNEEEFERLTLADRRFFRYQLMALKNLLDANVSFHPAIVASFSEQKGINELKEMLREIDPSLPDALEIEYIVLYPHVIKRLKMFRIYPKRAYTTNWELIGEEEFRLLYL